MRSSVITENELLKLSAISPQEMVIFIKKNRFGLKEALNFRREMQIALTHYSKGKPYDTVQERIIMLTMAVERWAREHYLADKMAQLFRLYDNFRNNPAAAKMEAKAKWEKKLAAWSY